VPAIGGEIEISRGIANARELEITLITRFATRSRLFANSLVQRRLEILDDDHHASDDIRRSISIISFLKISTVAMLGCCKGKRSGLQFRDTLRHKELQAVKRALGYQTSRSFLMASGIISATVAR